MQGTIGIRHLQSTTQDWWHNAMFNSRLKAQTGSSWCTSAAISARRAQAVCTTPLSPAVNIESYKQVRSLGQPDALSPSEIGLPNERHTKISLLQAIVQQRLAQCFWFDFKELRSPGCRSCRHTRGRSRPNRRWGSAWREAR